MAVNRHSGEQLWSQSVGAGSLIAEHIQHTPVLFVATRAMTRQRGDTAWLASLVAIDKRTGKRVAEHRSGVVRNYNALTINVVERYVELRAYNQRLRLSTVRDVPLAAAVATESVAGRFALSRSGH